MKRDTCRVVLSASVALVIGSIVLGARADNPLKLLPTPKLLKVEGGSIPLTAENRIVATDPKLKPLAGILSDEILLITKVRLATADDEPKAGDIVLKLNPKLRADADIWTVKGQDVVQVREYAHTIEVTDRTVVEGWDYRAVCEGTATLLQALQIDGDKVAVPKMTVKDWPHADFTGTMPDCARQPNPAYTLKTVVEACRYFKVRYVHLHLSDDSAFTFPSKSHPDASRIHAPNVPPYTLEELNDLVAYADARGVTCVPEFEAPGHCTALLDGMKGKLGSAAQRCMDVLNPEIYPIIDAIVGDMCEVFKSSPYFHIGGDEVEPAWYKSNPHVQKYIKDNNITDDHYLFLPYGKNMAEICKKYGKKAVMWEGFRVGVPFDPSLSKDIVVYAWYGGAGIAQNNGFATITVPWEVKIPFPQWSMYNCNGYVHDRTKDRVLGASRPMWEVDGYVMAKPYMRGLPERQERTWSPDAVIEDDYHKNRMSKQSDRMEMITQPVKFAYAGDIKNGIFSEPVTVTLTPFVPDLQIRYRLDGKEPTMESALYEKPFKAAESLKLRAALYDKDGKRVGCVALGEHIRYVGFVKSLSTGKPVETSGGKNGAEKAEYAADGWADINKFWGTKPAPAWWKVDLEKEYSVDQVQVVPYFDGQRYYQYTVEVSGDGQTWKQVVDASKNTEVGTEKGYTHKFEPVKARYVRVNMLKNSDNPAVHIVEVRVFEAGQ